MGADRIIQKGQMARTARTNVVTYPAASDTDAWKQAIKDAVAQSADTTEDFERARRPSDCGRASHR